jgi:hypothetical protein
VKLSTFKRVVLFTHAVLISDARAYGSITPAMVVKNRIQAKKAVVDLTHLTDAERGAFSDEVMAHSLGRTHE